MWSIRQPKSRQRNWWKMSCKSSASSWPFGERLLTAQKATIKLVPWSSSLLSCDRLPNSHWTRAQSWQSQWSGSVTLCLILKTRQKKLWCKNSQNKSTPPYSKASRMPKQLSSHRVTHFLPSLSLVSFLTTCPATRRLSRTSVRSQIRSRSMTSAWLLWPTSPSSRPFSRVSPKKLSWLKYCQQLRLLVDAKRLSSAACHSLSRIWASSFHLKLLSSSSQKFSPSRVSKRKILVSLSFYLASAKKSMIQTLNNLRPKSWETSYWSRPLMSSTIWLWASTKRCKS